MPDKLRRAILMGVAGGVAGKIVADLFSSTIDVLFRPSIEKAKDDVFKIFSGFKPKEEVLANIGPFDPRNIQLVNRIIGLEPGKLIKVAGGRDHYLYPNIMHPDNELALNTMTKVFQESRHNFIQDNGGDFSSAGSFICFGGPISNLRAATFLGYEKIDPQNPHLGFRPRADSPLKLAIEFEVNSETLWRNGLTVSGGIHNDPTPEWALRLRHENNELLQTKAGKVDYLLISRLPNWIEPQSSTHRKNPNIVTVFAGCHGTGVGALRILFNDGALLTALDDLTKQHRYWQAVIRTQHIENLQHPVTGTLRFQALALESKLVTFSSVSI